MDICTKCGAEVEEWVMAHDCKPEQTKVDKIKLTKCDQCQTVYSALECPHCEHRKVDSVGNNSSEWIVTETTMLHVESWNAAIEAAAELFDEQASKTEDSFYAADCEDAAEQIRKLKK